MCTPLKLQLFPAYFLSVVPVHYFLVNFKFVDVYKRSFSGPNFSFQHTLVNFRVKFCTFIAWTEPRTLPQDPSLNVVAKLLYVYLTYALYCMASHCEIYVVLLKMCRDFHCFYFHLRRSFLLGRFVAGFLLEVDILLMLQVPHSRLS